MDYAGTTEALGAGGSVMLRLFTPYILIAGLTSGALGYVQYLRLSLDRVTTQRDQLGADLNLCLAQVTNLQEDIHSDNQVDLIDDLSDFGQRWLMLETTGTTDP